MIHASIILKYYEINMQVLHRWVTATNVFPCPLKNSKQTRMRREFSSMKLSPFVTFEKSFQKHHGRRHNGKVRAESVLATS